LFLKLGMVNAKVFRQVLNVVWGGLRLAIEEGCAGYLIAAELFGDFLEGDLLLGLGFEQSLG